MFITKRMNYLTTWRNKKINKINGERLTALGFGIPNLLKFGEVGYFPEQFILDVGLQGKTALEFARYFI